MGIVHNLGITVIAVGLVIFTASVGWIILHTGRRFLYHWRHAAHVIAATWEPEPIPGFIGSMMLADDGEWNGGTFAFAPAPVDWPEDEPDPDPDHIHNGSCGGNRCWDGRFRPPYHDARPIPDEWTDEALASFPRWDEPTHTIIIPPLPLPPELAAWQQQRDNDVALFLSWFRSQVAAERIELAKVLAA